jgi:hypothetical protein
MEPAMLLPLLNRPSDMADLLNHPKNAQFFSLVKNALGEEAFSKCRKLWCECPREAHSEGEWAFPDLDWLLRSRALLVKGCEDDRRLWSEWCRIVGWEESSPLLNRFSGPERPAKADRLRGHGDMENDTSNHQSSASKTIVEEEEC